VRLASVARRRRDRHRPDLPRRGERQPRLSGPALSLQRR
jgi:hypothetical protein